MQYDPRIAAIRNKGVNYPDFPKPNMVFVDIFPIIGDPQTLELVTTLFAERLNSIGFDKILMLYSRGFLMAPPLALRTGKPCYPIRKKGKLPGYCVQSVYSLEYGEDVIEMQKSVLKEGDRVVLIDDVLATGGTLNATIALVEGQKAYVVQILLLNRVEALKGIEKVKIDPAKVYSIYNI